MRSENPVVALALAATLLVAVGNDPLIAVASPTARTAPEVRGSVVLPDEGSPRGLYAYLTSATRRDSVAIGEAGTFLFSAAPGHCGPLELRIDAPAGVDRRYHPALVGLDASGRPLDPGPGPQRARTAGDLRILLVPTRVTIDGGTHAGTVVPIFIDAAFAPSWERTRYWRVSRAPGEGFGTPVAWPESFFPIPVTLRAPGGVSHADSTAFWRSARQLEVDFGRSLFVPAPDEPADEEIWKIIVTVEPMAGSAGMTFVTYDSFGAIYEVTVAIRVRSYFADARLISHELMHALGFGHSGGWYSAAGPSPDTPSRATASDVAYAQLLYRLRRAHISQEATHGILASSREMRRALSARASRCAP